MLKEWHGWIISADASRCKDRQRKSRMFAARIADPDTAMSAVRTFGKIRDERLKVLAEVSMAEMNAMKVPDGKVRRIQSAPKRSKR